jgi:hypothetical protein
LNEKERYGHFEHTMRFNFRVFPVVGAVHGFDPGSVAPRVPDRGENRDLRGYLERNEPFLKRQTIRTLCDDEKDPIL